MTRPEAIQHIREAAKNIALQMMKIHPALSHLQDAETMSESLKCLHEMTIHLEVIKKKIGKLERQDDSTVL
jgi:thymidylate synthase ThyX